MGKNNESEKNIKNVVKFEVSKKKSFLRNFQKFTHFLKQHQSSILTTQQFIKAVHQYIGKCFKVIKMSQKDIRAVKQKIRICKQCNDWASTKKTLIECHSCEDQYHAECVGIINVPAYWSCFSCQIRQNISKQEKVGTGIKNESQYIISEDKIDLEKQEEKKVTKTKIESFKQEIRTDLLEENRFEKHKTNFSENDDEKEEEMMDENKTLPKALNQGRRTFFSSFPSMREEEIDKYKGELLKVIAAKNMKHTENLIPQNCNIFQHPSLSCDFGIRQLSTEDLQFFKNYKSQPFGPFIFEYKKNMGYNVKADKKLLKGMIVCEYVGEVYTHREVIEKYRESDSLMELRSGKNADETLFIVPDKFTNIGRFFNGINNFQEGQRGNLRSLRIIGEGRPMVILYTCQTVEKGQSLLYDYNAGKAKMGIDTSNYV